MDPIFVSARNKDAINTAIKAVEDGATEFTMDYDALVALIDKLEQHPALQFLPVGQRAGVEAWLESAPHMLRQDSPSHKSTQVLVEWHEGGWCLADVYRVNMRCARPHDGIGVLLSEDVAEDVVDRFRSTFQTMFD